MWLILSYQCKVTECGFRKKCVQLILVSEYSSAHFLPNNLCYAMHAFVYRLFSWTQVWLYYLICLPHWLFQLGGWLICSCSFFSLSSQSVIHPFI